MERILAVVDETDRSLQLLEEMADLAEGAEATLYVLSILSEDEYEEIGTVVGKIAQSERTTYKNDPEEAAAQIGRQAIEEEFGNIKYEDIFGVVADRGERDTAILEIADEHDVDHIAMVGRRRSPTGKALFGDDAQGVILNFDGKVTVAMQ